MAATVTGAGAVNPPPPGRDYPCQCSTRCKQGAFIDPERLISFWSNFKEVSMVA